MSPEDAARLVRRLAGRLRSRSRLDADDLHGEGLLALTRAGFPDGGLAHKIADGAMHDALRRERTQQQGRVDPAEIDNVTSEGTAGNYRLWEAVKALPPKQYQAISLHYWAGHTAEEVAAIMEISPAGAKRCIERALDSMRELLGSSGRNTPPNTAIQVEGEISESIGGIHVTLDS